MGRGCSVTTENASTGLCGNLVRAIYFTETGRVLPESTRRAVINLSTKRGVDPATDYPLLTHVRGGDGMGRYPGVFDYKWLAVTGASRAHAIAMLLWDRLMFMAVFHDPTCACGECRD